MVIIYKKWKKYNEILLTKTKMDLNIPKTTNHPPSRQSSLEVLVYKCLTISSFSLRIHIVHLYLHCRKKASTIQHGYSK